MATNAPKLYIPVPAPVVDQDRKITRDWALMFDQIVARIFGAGNVTGPSVSSDGGIVLFDGTTGALLKQATGTGPVHATSGVYSVSDVTLAEIVPASAATRLLGRGSAAGAGDFQELTISTGLTLTGTVLTATGTGGTVTSVAQTVPSILAVSGSPITTSGTLAITLATQTANTVFAGPTTGGAATPTFRALVAADLSPFSGTYTPTLTNVANVAASTAYVCQYLRVGSVVTVSGKVDVDPTVTVTATQLGISLPIASALTLAEQCGGTAVAPGVAGQCAAIVGDATNDRAEMQWMAVDVTNQAMVFSFTYQVF